MYPKQNTNSEMADGEIKIWIVMKLNEMQEKIENQHRKEQKNNSEYIYITNIISGNKKSPNKFQNAHLKALTTDESKQKKFQSIMTGLLN